MRIAGTSQLLEWIAANVRRARARKGVTQEALAEKAAIDLSYLQRIERGATNLSVAVLGAIARALEVPPDRFLRKAALPPARRGRPPKQPRRYPTSAEPERLAVAERPRPKRRSRS